MVYSFGEMETIGNENSVHAKYVFCVLKMLDDTCIFIQKQKWITR